MAWWESHSAIPTSTILGSNNDKIRINRKTLLA
jgi:hypothetical protein